MKDKIKNHKNRQYIKFCINKKRSAKYILFIWMLTLILSGCNVTLYKIQPEGKNATNDKVTVNVAPSEENTTEPVNDSGSNSTSNTTTDMSTDTVVVSDSTTTVDDGTLSEDVSSDADQVVEELFINQFSNDIDFDIQIPIEELDNTNTSWSFKRNMDHSPVTAYNSFDISKYGGYFIKATDEKVVYLTFDEGYENGFTPKILDVLKDNNVKAAFFITGDYIKRSSDLVKRMADEGHIVGNHSVTHPEFPTLDETTIYNELTGLADKYESLVGKKMDPFFRPPAGKYSERILYLTRKLGFRTIFWSMAYKDWVTAEQPGKEAAYQHVLDNYHNGAIILLHAVSESNTEALDSIIKELKSLGYRFGSLYELE